MKRSERLLALFLALALVCGLLPTGIFAAEPGQQTSGVNLIPDGSFENSVDNDVTGQVSDKETGTVIWNGATPSSTWRHLFDNGKVIFEIVKDAAVAQDGEYCVKITPSESGRAGIQFNTSDLVVGAEYIVTMWYKAEGTPDFTGRFQAVHLSSGNKQEWPALTGEWQKHEYRFTNSGQRATVNLNFGMSGAGTTGSIYIDNISLVRVPKAEKVTLDTEEVWLEPGDTKTLVPTITPSDIPLEIVYKSADAAVATVDADGKITAVGLGETVITVTATGGASATCTVKVVDGYIPATAIAISPATLSVTPGWQQKLVAQFTPENATNQEIVWTSSDNTVVNVDKNGNIVALKSGTANITATSGSLSATCAVTVAEDSSYQNQTGSLSVEFGQSSTLDLSTILQGTEYTVISAPSNGMITMDGSNITYTSYTWLMPQSLSFTDQSYIDFSNSTYTDSLVVAVKNGDKTATITLDVSIGKLADLFYDDAGNWISDVELMFSEEHLNFIHQKIKAGDQAYINLALKVVNSAKSKLNSVPEQYSKPDYSKVSYSYDTNSRSNADTTVIFLMAYLVAKGIPGYEQDAQTYLNKTIEWASACLWYPFWGTYGYQNNDLAGGHHLFAMAMVYNWLKEELADKTVDHRIGTDGSSEEAWNNTVKVYEDQPFLEALEMRLWQAGFDMYRLNYNYNVYSMNHLHIRMNGLLAAALALREQENLTAEEQATIIKWAGMALYKLGIAMNSLMPDGTSQEGMAYWEYGAEFIIKAGESARTALGIDMFKMTEVYKNSGSYILYNLLPGGRGVLNIGDANTHYPSAWALRWIAAEYGDANAQWLANQLGGDNWISLILADTTLAPVAPKLDETLHWFKDMDHVISRNDWSNTAYMLSIKCGVPMGQNLMTMIQLGEYVGDPDAGHAHPDANHISLFANGEYILRDDGYSQKKYSYTHNTLLVNGKGQLGEGYDWMEEGFYTQEDARPHMKVVQSNSMYDYIVGDATEAYPGNLGLYMFERNVILLKDEQVMLVVDNILSDDGSKLELRWYPGATTVVKNRNHFMTISEKNKMNLYTFTGSVENSYEIEENYYIQNGTIEVGGIRQTHAGGKWQNAVAVSWSDPASAPVEVRYAPGAADEHQFEINGKIYTINVATNTVTVADGQIADTDPEAASDSSLSGIFIDGEAFEGFDPEKTEYTVTRWWDSDHVKIEAFAAVPGATVTIDATPEKVTITCVSKDGTSTTVYEIDCGGGLEEIKLTIIDAVSDVDRDDQDLASSYDGVVSINNNGPHWTVKAPESGKINIVYDFGQLVRLQSVDIAMQNSKARTNYYDLLVSKDGENWTMVQEMAGIAPTADISSNNHAPRTVLEDANLIARYVKVVLRGNSTGEGDSFVDNRDKAGVFSGINEITCYGWKLDDEMEKLTIVDAESDVDREDQDLASSYDGTVSINNNGPHWTVKAPESGKINIVYDMGKIVKIMKIDLAMQNSKARTNYYDLLVSKNGEVWTMVQEMAGIAPTADISSNNHAFRTILNGEEIEARYIKVVLRGNSTGEGESFVDNRDKAGVFSGVNEIAVYGDKLELPLEKLTIVDAESDVDRADQQLSSSYDGVVSINNNGPHWTVKAPESGKINIVYDLGKVSLVRQIDLAMQNSKARTNYYDLLVSVDGETWTMVQEMAGIAPTADISENNHAFRTILENADLTARYIKVVLRGNSSGEGEGFVDNRDKAGVFSGVNEIAVFGNKLHVVEIDSATEGAEFTILGEQDFYLPGDEISVTANVPENMKFVRWDAEGIELADPTNPTVIIKIGSNSIKLTAVYESTIVVIPQVTVTFDSNGGSAVEAQTIDAGSKATAPAAPTKEGFTFKGWFNGETEWKFDTDTVSEDITLTAKWEEIPAAKVTVTFDSNGGSAVEAQTIDAGSKATAPAAPTKEGFTFKGWFNGETEWKFDTDTVSEDITLTAKWEEIPAAKVTVTFDSNGGSAVEAQTIDAGSKATAPAAPTKEGFTFKGWFNGETEWKFDTDTVSEDITLTAKWESAPVPPAGDGVALTAMAIAMVLAVAAFVTTIGSKKKYF